MGYHRDIGFLWKYPQPRATRVVVVCLGLVFSASALPAQSSAPWEYLHAYLEARATLETDGPTSESVVEIRGVVHGKLSSPAVTTWIIRDQNENVSYQFCSSRDWPEFPVGVRVRALGRGAGVPGASLELVAMIHESEIAEWERRNTPVAQNQPYREPTRIITYSPQRTPAAPPQPATTTPSMGESCDSHPVAKARAASPPATPPPPRWKEPRAPTPKPATTHAAPSHSRSTSQAWANYLRAYTHAVRCFNPRLSAAQADAIARSIIAFSLHYRIDPRLVVAVIAVESGFKPTATSHKGAMGLGQLMPGTAAGLGVRNAYDPVENIYGAVRLLRGHLQHHSGKPFWEQLSLALASYNAGSGAVRKYGGIPPYRETQQYILKVGRLYAHLCGYRATK